MIENGLFSAKVFHKRLLPRVNAFTYRVYYLALPLSRLNEVQNAMVGVDRFRPMSIYHRDHGMKDGSDMAAWARGVLAQFGVDQADGEIVLVAHPRVMGHVFNPVSFWFCLDTAGQLRAVLAEVNNTFKERLSYLIAHDDQRVIMPQDVLTANKAFHVSPFLHVKGRYRFRFYYSEQALGVWIDYDTEEGEVLKTSLTGKLLPLNNASALKAFLALPLVTLRTIALIHWQALKLWIKGIRYVPKPPSPEREVSR